MQSLVPALEAATGIRRGRLEALLKILAVDGVVGAAVRRLGRPPGQPWYFDEAEMDARCARSGPPRPT